MATTLTITIDLDAEGFQVAPDYGVIRVLQTVIRRIERGLLSGAIIGTDVTMTNAVGDPVGSLTVYPDSTERGR